MMKRNLPILFLMSMAWLGSESLSRSQELPSACPTPAPPVAASEPCNAVPCKKAVCPSVEMRTNERVCYDVKVEEYARPRCFSWRLRTDLCPCWDPFYRAPEPVDPDCAKYGKPHCRRVLMKTIIQEKIPTPKAEVHQVPCTSCEDAGRPAR